MTSWFVSDIHLKNINERNGNTLLRFLFLLNQNPKEHQIFFLGDIFDFWISNGPAFVRQFKALIDQIEKFKLAGGQVFYFEGNHDFHVDVFWTKKLNIPVYENECYFKIGKLTVRLEHGDFINPDDINYQNYRRFVRQPWIEIFGHILPGWFWKPIGERLSEKSRKRTGYYAKKNSEKVITLIRAYAHKVYAEKEFDIIVTGHMHVPDEYSFQVGDRKITSINLGTWLDKPRALKLKDDHFSVVDLEELLSHTKN